MYSQETVVPRGKALCLFPHKKKAQLGKFPEYYLPSSRSLSLASPTALFMPLTLLVVLRGVWGGVVIGTPVMKPSPFVPATTPERVPPTRGGLLMTVPGA